MLGLGRSRLVRLDPLLGGGGGGGGMLDSEPGEVTCWRADLVECVERTDGVRPGGGAGVWADIGKVLEPGGLGTLVGDVTVE